MNLIFFDNWCRPHLLPLTYTRPASELRVGILTIREKWERLLGQNSSTLSQIYLQEKFPLLTADDNRTESQKKNITQKRKQLFSDKPQP